MRAAASVAAISVDDARSIHHENAVHLAANLKAPFGALELAEAGGDPVVGQPQFETDRHSREGVLQVVASRNSQAERAKRNQGAGGLSRLARPAQYGRAHRQRPANDVGRGHVRDPSAVGGQPIGDDTASHARHHGSQPVIVGARDNGAVERHLLAKSTNACRRSAAVVALDARGRCWLSRLSSETVSETTDRFHPPRPPSVRPAESRVAAERPQAAANHRRRVEPRAPESTSAIIEVVVVLPCAPATAIA